MKKTAAIFILAFLILISTACKKEHGIPGKIKTETFLFDKPGGNKIKDIKKGTPCMALARDKYGEEKIRFFKIRTPGNKKGWVSENVLRISGISKAEILTKIPHITYLNKHLISMKNLINVKKIQTLINKGADINTTDENGDTPLHRTILFKSFDTVKVLLKNGANPNIGNRIGVTPFMLLSFSAIYNELVNLFFKSGADINIKDKYNRTALLHAAERCNLDFIKILLDKGADILNTSNNKRNALHLACVNVTKSGDKPATVKYLVEKGIDIHSKDIGGNTPLMLASYTWSNKTVRYLLSKGSKVNQNNAESSTALIQAASGHWFKQFPTKNLMNTVKTLLKAGAKINSRKTGFTALMYACYNGHTELVNLLIKKGAKINIKIADDKSFFPGYTCLMFAARKGDINTIKLLIQKGEKTGIKDAKGKTAYDIAIENKKTKAAELIKSLSKKK